jgi:hypothetical protein
LVVEVRKTKPTKSDEFAIRRNAVAVLGRVLLRGNDTIHKADDRNDGGGGELR